jgi:hypothetical protein
MSKIKILFFIVIVTVIGGFFGYKYIMTGGERNIESEKSAFVVSSLTVFNEFSENSELATSKYLNKAVEISGTITSISPNLIILDEKISCQFQIEQKEVVGSQIVIKGRVTGYDDLLEELKIDQCLILKKQ